MMVVGLVGKSCSGKNFVGSLLSEQGFEVWDLDVLGHEALECNAKAVVDAFGDDVRDPSSMPSSPAVSRKALSAKVFDEPSLRTVLEGILYPWMEERILSRASCIGDGVLVLNGALLHRAGMDAFCKAVIYVDAPYEVRLERALFRDGISKESFQKREASQPDVDFRCNTYACPVFVVENGFGTKKAELNRQIRNICDRIGITYIKGNEYREEK